MARVTVVPGTIDYPDSDGLPMAENESQFWPILYAGSALDRYYQDRDDVYVVGNLLLYYREGNPREGDFGASISADVMVVIGASKHVRPSYKLWEEPKAPDFVLEIASEGTQRADSGTKRGTCAEIGVAEYWQVDAAGGAPARQVSDDCFHAEWASGTDIGIPGYLLKQITCYPVTERPGMETEGKAWRILEARPASGEVSVP